jgi:hypothetical protein
VAGSGSVSNAGESTRYRSLSDASVYVLSAERESALLFEQYECTLVWTNLDGHGVGVTQAFVFEDGCFWLACELSRARVRALLRDPRCSIVVSGIGTSLGRSKSLSYKGHAEIIDDRETTLRVLSAILTKYDPDDPDARASHLQAADHPGRIIIKVTPAARTNAWDGDQVRH